MAKEIKDLAASVRALLTEKARQKGEDVQSLLTRYGIERFLYRLSISEHKDRFLLKGAALFSLWFDQPHRPTKDLDLLGFGSNDIAALEETLRDICSTPAEDGLVFLQDSIRGERIREDEAYEGVRINLIALLGRARLPLQIDVGFGDAVTPGPTVDDFPTLLDFPAPHLKVYPKETVVAEKFEAMVKLGIANSRMKDFWDVNFMIDEFDFDGALLQKALRATFETRKTSFPVDPPIALLDEFATDPLVRGIWGGFIRRNRIERSTELSTIVDHLRSFLGPIIDAENKGEQFRKKWVAGDNWN